MKQKLRLITDTNIERQPVERLLDDDLMRLAALDRRDAFETLIHRHQQLVFGLATRYLGNREKGRDVTQDVFLSLWADRHKYRPSGKFRSYITSVCLNRCRVVSRGMSRQAGKVAEYAQEIAAEAPDGRGRADMPLDSLLESERRKEIQGYLTKLPENCRTVMIYRYTHDMPLAIIAETTGMPLGTVKSHLLRGVHRIRQMMKKGA